MLRCCDFWYIRENDTFSKFTVINRPGLSFINRNHSAAVSLKGFHHYTPVTLDQYYSTKLNPTLREASFTNSAVFFQGL